MPYDVSNWSGEQPLSKAHQRLLTLIEYMEKLSKDRYDQSSFGQEGDCRRCAMGHAEELGLASIDKYVQSQDGFGYIQRRFGTRAELFNFSWPILNILGIGEAHYLVHITPQMWARAARIVLDRELAKVRV